VSEVEIGGVIAAATIAPHGAGRVFEGTRPVRLADADQAGRLRLDALARHLQDVATDDVTDAGIGNDGLTWVVRRAAVVIEQWPRYGEWVTYSTFCSGIGPRWADRRTSCRGKDGAHVEASVLWVSFDLHSGRPAGLPEGFHHVWSATAGARRVSARLLHPPAPDGVSGRLWQVRVADIDVLGHVNNTVYWALVEDELARLLPDRTPVAAECEYRVPLELDDMATLVSDGDGQALRVWVVSPRGTHASALVHTRPSVP
jgi:acyl-ACP thioesterase